MISDAKLEQAINIIRQGGLIVYPTETFYALGADYSQASAISRLLRLKGRADNHPLPLIINNQSQLPKYCHSGFNLERIRPITQSFWPGPLTLVLPAIAGLHAALISPPLDKNGLAGVALRVSSHPLARQLATSTAIISTSANISGQPPAICIEDLAQPILAGVDMVVDGGDCVGGLPSTILDVRCAPRVVRPGALRLPEWCFNL